jgi:hypothetical protein
VPELASINAVELVVFVSKQLAQSRVVKQQSAILIHHQQCSRTELQDFAKLALVLGGLDSKCNVTIRRRRSGPIAGLMRCINYRSVVGAFEHRRRDI